MKRVISAETEEAAKNRRIFPFILVEMDFSSGMFRMCTGNVNIIWKGNTFQAGGGILGLSQVEESSEIAANGYIVSLSPIPNHVRHPDGRTIPQIVYDEDMKWRNRYCSIYYGFFDGELSVIPEPVRIVKSRMDKLSVSEGPNSYSIQMTVEPKTISLNNPRISRYTPEDQRKKYPSDRIFDNVSKLATGYKIKWGKE